jgi:hypothetical protein
MLKAIINTFNICSSDKTEKQELKLDISPINIENIHSPIINLAENEFKFSKINESKMKNQNLLFLNPTNEYNNNFSTNLSFLSSNKKTKITEFEESTFLTTKKFTFSVEEIENNFKLILSDFEGDLLEGKILKINAAGLKYSLRNQKDGISFFGINNMNETNKNDFILNLQKIIFHKNKIIGTIFAIYFQKNENKYFLQSFITHSNEQIYYKIPIEIGYKIKNKERFQIGNNFFSVEIGENNNDIRIIIEDLDNQNNSLSYIFKKPKKNKPILLGRSSKCNIHISSNLLSKIHCNIIYDYDNNNFIMKDGFNNKYSTNGTWLVVNDKIDIINNKYEDYIKIGKKILKIEKKV